MSTEYIVSKLQVQLAAYREEVLFYKRAAADAETPAGGIKYDAERRYWSGMYDATYEAIAAIQDAESER